MKNGRNGKRQERKRGNIKVDWDRAEKEMRWVEKEQEKGEREGWGGREGREVGRLCTRPGTKSSGRGMFR